MVTPFSPKREQYKRFKDGRQAVSDFPRSDLQSTSTTDKYVEGKAHVPQKLA